MIFNNVACRLFGIIVEATPPEEAATEKEIQPPAKKGAKVREMNFYLYSDSVVYCLLRESIDLFLVPKNTVHQENARAT